MEWEEIEWSQSSAFKLSYFSYFFRKNIKFSLLTSSLLPGIILSFSLNLPFSSNYIQLSTYLPKLLSRHSFHHWYWLCLWCFKFSMASALSVEGFFSALTGGTNSEPEIDFPFDRLFRKIGVYLRCLMGAILIGASIQNPATCFSPGNENGKNEFVNSYCISLLKHPVK